MDGIHDLGGLEGFGAIVREENEPAFHARWEAAVFAMLAAARRTGALKNTDQFRHAIERIDPAAYLTHGYYGRWLGGIETLLVEAGTLAQAEIDERQRARGDEPSRGAAARPGKVHERPLPDPTAGGARRALARPPRFRPNDPVVTRDIHPKGHTRLPRYARGKRGVIVAEKGGWVFPDTNAHGLGENPEHLYGVRFTGQELWGEDAEAGVHIHLDLFESYLVPDAPSRSGKGEEP